MLKEEILSICGLGLADDKMSQLIEKAIAKANPYRHDESSILDACNVRPGEITANIGGKKQSEVVEIIEDHFSKRELAFLVHTQIRKVVEKELTPKAKPWVATLFFSMTIIFLWLTSYLSVESVTHPSLYIYAIICNAITLISFIVFMLKFKRV